MHDTPIDRLRRSPALAAADPAVRELVLELLTQGDACKKTPSEVRDLPTAPKSVMRGHHARQGV
jgi:hypothetical protein